MGIPCIHVVLFYRHRRLTVSELESNFHEMYRMDNVINDTTLTLTLTSFDNLIMTGGSLTMPDGGYSPTRLRGKRPMEKRRKPR